MNFQAIWNNDLAYSFRRSPVAIAAAVLTVICVGGALLAPWLAPHNPFDAASLDLNKAFAPPAWVAQGAANFPLGTDDQGRDILSTILYGARISLGVGVAAVLFALVIGVTLGLLSGYLGGRLDAFIMRIADIQLSFPAILIALLVDGVARVALPANSHDQIAIPVLILAIGVSGWVQYARTVRGSTLVEKNKEYVQAARVIGRPPLAIMLRHVLPNVMGPVLVIATIHIATAIITEATLSFLGVGVPPTRPSLGTLIRIGNEFLLSGEWWITVFPGIALVLGVSLGLLSGYVGGRLDALIMRVADIQLSFPAILIALLIDGIARVALPNDAHDSIAIPVLVLAIGVSGWVQYARTVRGSTLVERSKEYVQAARVVGRSPLAIMLTHVLPNVTGPVLVIGTIHIATAIITEATLSFLGVGVPATQPSLGTLIRIGNDFLFSGEWWITVFPGAALILLVLSVNLLGDWLRDALNPKLR